MKTAQKTYDDKQPFHSQMRLTAGLKVVYFLLERGDDRLSVMVVLLCWRWKISRIRRCDVRCEKKELLWSV